VPWDSDWLRKAKPSQASRQCRRQRRAARAGSDGGQLGQAGWLGRAGRPWGQCRGAVVELRVWDVCSFKGQPAYNTAEIKPHASICSSATSFIAWGCWGVWSLLFWGCCRSSSRRGDSDAKGAVPVAVLCTKAGSSGSVMMGGNRWSAPWTTSLCASRAAHKGNRAKNAPFPL
jgi:hypothetical protein